MQYSKTPEYQVGLIARATGDSGKTYAFMGQLVTLEYDIDYDETARVSLVMTVDAAEFTEWHRQTQQQPAVLPEGGRRLMERPANT